MKKQYIRPAFVRPSLITSLVATSLLGILGGALVSCASSDPALSGESAAVQKALEVAPELLTIDPAASIKADVSWLSDDAREGREAGSQAYFAAADYVADRFKALGVKPGNGDSYAQPVKLRISYRNDDAANFVIIKADGSQSTLTNKSDYLSGRSVQGEDFAVTAPLVFVGYGIVGDGYDNYEGLDVTGKIVVAFNGAPNDINSEIRAHMGSGRTKAEVAASKGAVGLIMLSANADNAEENWNRAVERPDAGNWGWVGPDGVANTPSTQLAPTFQMGPSGAAALFAGSPKSFDELRMLTVEQNVQAPLASFAMPVSVSLSGGGVVEDVTSSNVVGIIEGTDPKLKNEVVVLSAHLDHVGVYEPRGGGDDHIHNGALDNAMGVATLIDVARRFQVAGGPKRTVILLAVTAEEKGLVGSDYFANFPTVDAKRLVANVNLDMPLVLYPFTDVIAFGADRSTLGKLVRDAGQKMGVTLIDDPYPNLSLFVRSDHYNFVRKAIPSVFLFLGTGNGGQEVFETFMNTNYHRPSDDVSLPISWPDAARFAELNYLIAREIADSAERPVWKDGDFFGSAAGN